MVTKKIDVSPHVKRVLERIKDTEGHLTIDSVVRSRLRIDELRGTGDESPNP